MKELKLNDLKCDFGGSGDRNGDGPKGNSTTLTSALRESVKRAGNDSGNNSGNDSGKP